MHEKIFSILFNLLGLFGYTFLIYLIVAVIIPALL
jgi:phage shock protein PspC (stress-responsive transcriptional regulator)